MGLNWIRMEDKKPDDGQVCLTVMKHGIISGTYDLEEDNFRGYYWHDIEWCAYAWIPIEEVHAPNRFIRECTPGM